MANKEPQSMSFDKKAKATYYPLVSIITPVLNGVKYLEPCILSVLNQSYPHIEHIFVDGGSTDGTQEMLSSYQAKYPDRIRFISEPGKGIAEAWNKGLRIAKGGIFNELGSDDMCEPGAIQTVVEFFSANPDAYFTFGECNVMNEKGELLWLSPTKEFNLDELINKTNYIPCSSAFYKREVIGKVGFMDTSLPYTHDLDYWIRVGKMFPIHRIQKVLSDFRVHKGSIGGSKGAYEIYAREGFIISRRHGGSIFSPRARRYYKMLTIRRLRPFLARVYSLLILSPKAKRYHRLVAIGPLRPVLDRACSLAYSRVKKIFDD